MVCVNSASAFQVYADCAILDTSFSVTFSYNRCCVRISYYVEIKKECTRDVAHLRLCSCLEILLRDDSNHSGTLKYATRVD